MPKMESKYATIDSKTNTASLGTLNLSDSQHAPRDNTVSSYPETAIVTEVNDISLHRAYTSYTNPS